LLVGSPSSAHAVQMRRSVSVISSQARLLNCCYCCCGVAGRGHGNAGGVYLMPLTALG